MRSCLGVAIAVLLALISMHPVRAQSLHMDVEILLSNGPVAGSRMHTRFRGDRDLLIEGRSAIDHASGYGIWPANFGDLPGGAYSTDDPGFQAIPGTLLDLEGIYYRPRGLLQWWTPHARRWDPAAAGTYVQIEGIVPSSVVDAFLFGDPGAQALLDYYSTPTQIHGTGIVGPPTKLVDEARPDGSFHTHLNWFIEGARPAGAYLVELQLFDQTGKYLDSSPLYVLFNNG